MLKLQYMGGEAGRSIVLIAYDSYARKDNGESILFYCPLLRVHFKASISLELAPFTMLDLGAIWYVT